MAYKYLYASEPNKFHFKENIFIFAVMKDETYLKKLGLKVLQLREAKDISQRELARRVKSNNTQIERIETGMVNSSINMLRKIAKEFDMTIGKLVDVE